MRHENSTIIPQIDYPSLFDDQFEITSVNDNFVNVEAKNHSILNSARDAIRKAMSDDLDDEYKYVVQMDDAMKEALENGEIELIKAKDGGFYAQILRDDKKFGKRLPVDKELQEKGITSAELELALQMELIKDQLKSIIDTLQGIEGKVSDIVRGQQNDRLGLYYSGLNMYLEAITVVDETLRKQLMAQSIKALNDANAQMIQEIRVHLEYLVHGKYKAEKKKTEKIREHIEAIQQSYYVVYRASFLKASIYQYNSELKAMLTAIDEYGRFVERMIIPYAGYLSELDETTDFIESGTWGTIAKTLEGCKGLRERLVSQNSFKLQSGEQVNDI